jgi:hypothetical protein
LLFEEFRHAPRNLASALLIDFVCVGISIMYYEYSLHLTA